MQSSTWDSQRVKFDGHAGGLISFRKPPTTTTKSIGAEVQISSPWEAEENFSERMAEASKVGEAMHRIVMGCCCGILGILLERETYKTLDLQPRTLRSPPNPRKPKKAENGIARL